MRQPRMDDAKFGRHLAMHTGQLAAGGVGWFAGFALILAAPFNASKGSMLEAALSAVGGIAFLLMPVWRWRQRVDVFEGGVVWRGLIGMRRLSREQFISAKYVRRSSRMHTRKRTNTTWSSQDEVQLETSDGEVTWVGLERSADLCELLRMWAAPPKSSGVQGSSNGQGSAGPAYGTDSRGAWVPPPGRT